MSSVYPMADIIALDERTATNERTAADERTATDERIARRAWSSFRPGRASYPENRK